MWEISRARDQQDCPVSHGQFQIFDKKVRFSKVFEQVANHDDVKTMDVLRKRAKFHEVQLQVDPIPPLECRSELHSGQPPRLHQIGNQHGVGRGVEIQLSEIRGLRFLAPRTKRSFWALLLRLPKLHSEASEGRKFLFIGINNRFCSILLRPKSGQSFDFFRIRYELCRIPCSTRFNL